MAPSYPTGVKLTSAVYDALHVPVTSGARLKPMPFGGGGILGMSISKLNLSGPLRRPTSQETGRGSASHGLRDGQRWHGNDSLWGKRKF